MRGFFAALRMTNERREADPSASLRDDNKGAQSNDNKEALRNDKFDRRGASLAFPGQ
jgi:hypothetical protein